MKVLAFSALVNALAATGLGLFVYFRDPAAARNRIYGLYCLSIAFWSFFYCGWQLTESKDLAVSLLRLVMAGASLIPVLYFHHTVTFLDITARHARALKLGYALAGLPDLIAFAPDEPELRETVRAVADFLAATVDPAGGWRYPHPRSSSVIVSQGLEHAWQLTQAARALGPEPRWLDAIETVLRARILCWQRTGKILSGLEGWEFSTGKIKDRREIYSLYQKPADRDRARDYLEGKVSLGSAPPEGLVYFAEVLGNYLQHRPAARLLVEPKADEPLGQLLNRIPATTP